MLAHWYGAPTSALTLRAAMARRTLDLPEDFRATWRLSADNCLVYGTSVLGGRKYYLPTGQVHPWGVFTGRGGVAPCHAATGG